MKRADDVLRQHAAQSPARDGVVTGMRLLFPVLVLLTACVPHNRLGLAVDVTQGDGWWAGTTAPPASNTPVVLFLDGDGGQCERFSEARWRRFLLRLTGRFVLVRPATLVNVTCESKRWEELDFLHRVDELEALVRSVRERFPTQPLVLLGHSAGAHVARLFASAHPGIVAGVINVSGGYDELAAVLSDGGHGTLVSRLRSMDPAAPFWNRRVRFWQQMLASGVRPLWLAERGPCLVLHGTADAEIVPWAGVKADATAVLEAGGTCTLEALEGAGHDTLTAATFARIDAWLEEQWGVTPG